MFKIILRLSFINALYTVFDDDCSNMSFGVLCVCGTGKELQELDAETFSETRESFLLSLFCVCKKEKLELVWHSR